MHKAGVIGVGRGCGCTVAYMCEWFTQEWFTHSPVCECRAKSSSRTMLAL